MAVDKRGKEILEEAKFDKFKQAFIDSIMRKISIEGRYGTDIRPIIEETLKEEDFIDFFNKLAEIIRKKTEINGRECDRTASALVEEAFVKDISDVFSGQLKESKESRFSKEEMEIYRKGERFRLWKDANLKRFLGGRPEKLNDIIRLFREHSIIKAIVFIGIGALGISAVLFGSIYKALVVGLTLTMFSGETLQIKIANILGGIGGVLIFFTSITILLEYILLTARRNEQIQEMARRYFEKKRG
ncbi:MAG: hypothetical protein DRN05_04085 [Thermoplasmata archaeon]|nr:MAG: hypothetical protein DRN05_04085 [Thermoplasmata archaeon]